MRYALCALRQLGRQNLIARKGEEAYQSPGACHEKISDNEANEEKSHLLE
jgi:hypothetical protein